MNGGGYDRDNAATLAAKPEGAEQLRIIRKKPAHVAYLIWTCPARSP